MFFLTTRVPIRPHQPEQHKQSRPDDCFDIVRSNPYPYQTHDTRKGHKDFGTDRKDAFIPPIYNIGAEAGVCQEPVVEFR
jgi:hypothetical protein